MRNMHNLMESLAHLWGPDDVSQQRAWRAACGLRRAFRSSAEALNISEDDAVNFLTHHNRLLDTMAEGPDDITVWRQNAWRCARALRGCVTRLCDNAVLNEHDQEEMQDSNSGVESSSATACGHASASVHAVSSRSGSADASAPLSVGNPVESDASSDSRRSIQKKLRKITRDIEDLWAAHSALQRDTDALLPRVRAAERRLEEFGRYQLRINSLEEQLAYWRDGDGAYNGALQRMQQQQLLQRRSSSAADSVSARRVEQLSQNRSRSSSPAASSSASANRMRYCACLQQLVPMSPAPGGPIAKLSAFSVLRSAQRAMPSSPPSALGPPSPPSP